MNRNESCLAGGDVEKNTRMKSSGSGVSVGREWRENAILLHWFNLVWQSQPWKRSHGKKRAFDVWLYWQQNSIYWHIWNGLETVYTCYNMKSISKHWKMEQKGCLCKSELFYFFSSARFEMSCWSLTLRLRSSTLFWMFWLILMHFFSQHCTFWSD